MSTDPSRFVRKNPCASCPYRRDVPSGVWAATEYAKLLAYDGEPADQVHAEDGLRIFSCHQGDHQVCAGWAGHRPAHELIALRFGVSMGELDPSVLSYQTDVPLFGSGAEAAEHGMRDIENPDDAATAATRKISRVRERRGDPVGWD